MNKVILMGRLTADPELRQTNSGTNVCRFTVACDRRVAKGAEKQADFISCVAWSQTAELISRYFSKGRMIAVEGNIRTGSYNDKNHPDVKHYTTEVWVDQMHFCGDKPANNDSNSGYNAGGYGEPQKYAAPAPAQYSGGGSDTTISVGDFGDFEEVIGDSELPF